MITIPTESSRCKFLDFDLGLHVICLTRGKKNQRLLFAPRSVASNEMAFFIFSDKI